MLNVAVLGAGAIGSVHARNLHNHSDLTLYAVADPLVDRAEALCAQYGGQPSPSAESVIADTAVDAVIIGSATSAHKDQLLLAAKHGMPVLCEKPLATNMADALDGFAAVRSAGLVGVMGFNRRLDRSYARLHELVQGGAIGRPESLRFVSRSNGPPLPQSAASSGGMIREKGAHFYDLACWITRSEPVEVTAYGACLIDKRFQDFDDVDTALILLRMDNDALVVFEFGRRTTYGQDEVVEAFGSGGQLIVDRAGSLIKTGDRPEPSTVCTSWQDRFEPTYRAELDRFAAAIAGTDEAHATLQDGLRAQAIAEAAHQSIREKRSIPIDPVWL